MSFRIAVIGVALFFVRSSDAQLPGAGECPAVEAKRDFELTKFAGKWYEVAKYFTLFEATGKCVTETIGVNGSDVSITHREVNYFNGHKSKGRVAAYRMVDLSPNKNNGSLGVITSMPFPVRIDVLDTDYDGWAVLYSCMEIPFIGANMKLVFIYSRSRFTSASDIMRYKASSILEKAEIDQDMLIPTEQFLCPVGH